MSISGDKTLYGDADDARLVLRGAEQKIYVTRYRKIKHFFHRRLVRKSIFIGAELMPIVRAKEKGLKF